MHKNFEIILQTAFNCFAKKELKRLNQCQGEAPAKMSKTLKDYGKKL